MGLLSSLVKSQKVVALAPSATVFEASQTMANNKIGSIVVMENDRLMGIFTERDLLNRVVAKGGDAKKTLLSEVMSKNVITGSINETIEGCFAKMESTKCRRLPIMDGNRVVGMVTMRNIL